jgi:hypothetical protein
VRGGRRAGEEVPGRDKTARRFRRFLFEVASHVDV